MWDDLHAEVAAEFGALEEDERAEVERALERRADRELARAAERRVHARNGAEAKAKAEVGKMGAAANRAKRKAKVQGHLATLIAQRAATPARAAKAKLAAQARAAKQRKG